MNMSPAGDNSANRVKSPSKNAASSEMKPIHVFLTVPILITLTVLMAGAGLLPALAFGLMSIVGSVLLLTIGEHRSSSGRSERRP